MDKYILPEGEACLLVAVFEHLGEYSERAEENDTSVSDELSECLEDISVYTDVLTHAMEICLNDREYDVIARHYELSPYTECSTLEEIARNFNVTRERIRQIEARALQKLKRFSTELNNTEARMATEALKAYKKGRYAQWMHAQENGDRGAVNAYVHNYRACVNAINKIEIQKQIRKYRDQTEWNGVERSGTE